MTNQAGVHEGILEKIIVCGHTTHNAGEKMGCSEA